VCVEKAAKGVEVGNSAGIPKVLGVSQEVAQFPRFSRAIFPCRALCVRMCV